MVNYATSSFTVSGKVGISLIGLSKQVGWQ